MALLACGCFVIVAISVFRLEANRDAARRTAGTGGFALLGESTMPVTQDLNRKSGREFFGLGADELAGVNIVPLRVRESATCVASRRFIKRRICCAGGESYRRHSRRVVVVSGESESL